MIGITAALLPGAALAAPWYDQPECAAALTTINRGELAPAKAAIAKLRRAKDPAKIACGVWLEMPLSEVEAASQGKSATLDARVEKRLGLLMKFARHFGPRDPSFADLELEARLRRIRILAKKGERMALLKEARRVKAMLDKRKTGPRTATVDYAEGVLNLALSDMSWAVRQALSLAGLSGTRAVGVAKLKAVAKHGSVYESYARYLLRHFSKGDKAEELKQSTATFRRFPDSPLFAYDYGLDLRDAGRCKDALSALAPLRAELTANPKKWSSQVRARLYWMNARCAADTGDLKTARADLALAEAQGFDHVKGRVDALKAELSQKP